MSPGQTYRQIRLARALWLMEYTVKSLSEISYECGFADASHFSRACREAFEASPSDIRAEMLDRAGSHTPSARSMISHLMPD
jgi:transcriptional regulator GlxA family with amidase domain